MTGDAQTRERIGHLYDYLGALAQEVYAKPARHIGDHETAVSPAEVPEHPSVRLGASAGDAWLRVAKTPKPLPPALPTEVAGLLRDVDRKDPHSTPRLPAGLADRLGEPTEDDPDPVGRVTTVFRTWLRDVWEPWAQQARRALAARGLYETLFRLRQRMRADGSTHELVWGHGVLGWKFAEHRVCHPLLITSIKIDFNEETGELALLPDGLPALELDCLQGLGVPGLGRLAQLAEELRAEPPEVWSDDRVRPLYRKILAPLGLDDRLDDGDDLPDIGPAPVVSATWRLVVRKRRVMFLRFFEQLKKGVAERALLPAPMVALAAGEEAAQSVLAAEGGDWSPVAERLLLPLAANDEQEQIVRKLAQHSGVTVQGPPGTGKSHTIANLVSHLVAHGKRVLVTAHKDQALAVLRDKIPDELRDLSLAVLGSSSADLTALQRSVQEIIATADDVDEAREARTIAALRKRLDAVQGEVLLLRKRLRESLERERETLELDGYDRPAAQVASWLAENEGRLGFVPDALPLSANCPLTPRELGELYALADEIGAEDALAAVQALPPAGELPTGAERAGQAAEMRRLEEILARYGDYVTDFARLDAFGDEALARLAEECGQAAHRLDGLKEPWLAQLGTQVAQDPQWRALWSGHAQRLRQDAHYCGQLRATIAGSRFELPEGFSHRETVGLLQQLRQRFAEGKKVSSLTQRSLSQFLKAVGIDGERPQTTAEVDKLLAFVELRRLRELLTQLWADELVAVLSAPMAPPASGAVETWIDARVQQIDAVLGWELDAWPRLRSRLLQVLAAETLPVRPVPADLHRLTGVLAGLRARAAQRRLQADAEALASYLVRARTAPGAGALWHALAGAAEASDWEGWDAALAETARLAALRPRVERLTDLYDRLATVAPQWARRIRETGGDPAACGAPADLTGLWQWRRAETWLRAIIDAGDLAQLQHRLDNAQQEQRRLTLELTHRSAWLAMRRNLGHTQRQALMGWLQTLRKIGKGTGAGAGKWRAEAQRLMPEAMGAVPVWIMPYYRVAESFDPMAAPPFDVVIIDESSQCDVFALGLLGLGHKVVVVGDDKQISPSAVGVRRDRVDELIRTHLPSFPNALLLDMESSLYDASARLFPGVVRLREHFRCLPGIIGFSSQHYYGGEIQPLREEDANRLPGPVVRAVHVPDGVRQDLNIGNVNQAEADALIDQVVQCCADPAYEGRSMGVVSLLSSSRQAQYIDQRLLDRLGPEEYERRGLRCGDAYSFQGDERDVMFISVVADDNRSPFTTRAYEQRVNVAASRARDQMWVFHSVQPHRLNPDDQRAKLIHYATDGQRSPALASDLESLCDSDFERRVLRLLLARGYRVTPQHRVGNLRIDLVVRRGRHKLAIECDGDKYHGADRWEDDLRRQTILERLGWRFWRVRGSAFYRDPDTAMSSLWPLLDELGITPGDDPDELPRPVEHITALTVEPTFSLAPEPSPHTDTDTLTRTEPRAPERTTAPPVLDTEPQPPSMDEFLALLGRPSEPVEPPVAAVTADDVRSWARAQGRTVGSRGRLARSIIDDYNWAHPEAPYVSEN
ncbi:AAA domain-containing protein [Spirillospora sp. CA-253888]